MINDIDAKEHGEVRTNPTIAQEALNIYKRNLEVRAEDKDYQYAHNVRSNCKVLQEFVDRFGPSRLIRECTETDLSEFYQMLCFPDIKPEQRCGLCRSRSRDAESRAESKTGFSKLAASDRTGADTCYTGDGER